MADPTAAKSLVLNGKGSTCSGQGEEYGVTCSIPPLAQRSSTFIEFDNVKFPIASLIHKENRGFEVIMSNFNAERKSKSLATPALRMSRVCCENAYKHVNPRETFEKKRI